MTYSTTLNENLWRIQFSSLLIMKAPSTRAQDHGRKQGRCSARRMDYTPAGEIDHTDPKQWIFLEGSQKAVVTPDGMDNDGVYESGQYERIA